LRVNYTVAFHPTVVYPFAKKNHYVEYYLQERVPEHNRTAIGSRNQPMWHIRRRLELSRANVAYN
jgi:hypothetical protein